MSSRATFVARLEMVQRAEHPADRVAQLAIGLDGVFQDFGADALVVGIVGGAATHSRRMSAPDCSITVCGSIGVAERLRHLAAVLVLREAMGQHDVERRAAAGAAALQQRRLEPAAMLVRPSRYITVSSPPSTLRLMPASPGKCTGSSSTNACVEPESNQTSQMSSTFFHSSLARGPRTLARAVHVPGVGALFGHAARRGFGAALAQRRS